MSFSGTKEQHINEGATAEGDVVVAMRGVQGQGTSPVSDPEHEIKVAAQQSAKVSDQIKGATSVDCSQFITSELRYSRRQPTPRLKLNALTTTPGNSYGVSTIKAPGATNRDNWRGLQLRQV